MADVGGDVVLLSAPRVRFQEQVRVCDYQEEEDSHRLERWESLKGGNVSASCRRRRKCALLVSSCEHFLPIDDDDMDADEDERALRAFLDNCPPDQDLVSLIPL